LDHIPTIGYSNPLLTFLTSIKYIFGARELLLEGYKLYPNGIFKLSTFDGWSVVVNGTRLVDDIRRSTGEQLHSMSAVAGVSNPASLNKPGARLLDNPFHIDVIRAALTRNIGIRFHDIHDEVRRAYADAIPSDNGEGDLFLFPRRVDLVGGVQTTSRRDNKGVLSLLVWGTLVLCERATKEIYKGRFIRLFPPFLRPLGTRLVTGIHGLRNKMENYIRPIMEFRLEQQKLHGVDWPGKPNDLISWLIDAAQASGEEVTVEDLSTRMLFTSFGAIHTSSVTFTAALFQLSQTPQDAEEIRKEVENVVKVEGWSKASVGKMHKLDSYLRESQRLHFMTLLTMGRAVVQDFTFSDGTVMPKNVAGISVNVYARHRDEGLYPDAYAFDGFRFVPKAGSGASQPLVATPTLEYHGFGHGRSTCPGRFFAVTELKTMLAHIVTNYDIKLEQDEYPPKMVVEANSIPNMSAKIMFRKRI
ncbi:hypothetical protein CVT25_010790, partial [Psilocybe cyanescens]